MRILSVLWLLAAACETCQYEIVAEVVVTTGGEAATPQADGGEHYCATTCEPGQPCTGGYLCSHIIGESGAPWGLCVKDRH